MLRKADTHFPDGRSLPNLVTPISEAPQKVPPGSMTSASSLGSRALSLVEERILHVEHGSFTPLIFPSSGGMSAEPRSC